MSAQIASGPDGAASATSAFSRLTQERHIPKHVDLGSLWERVAHRVGRTFVAMPGWMWLVLDVSILTFGFHVAYGLFPPIDTVTTPHIGFWQAVGIFGSIIAFASLVFGLYERDTVFSRSRILTRIMLTAGTVIAVGYAIIYVALYATLSRRATGLAVSMFMVGGTGVRLCAWWAVHKVKRGLLVVGSSGLFKSFQQAQEIGHLHEYRLVGYATPNGHDEAMKRDRDFLGSVADQVSNLRTLGVADIVVGTDAADHPKVMDWMVPCLQRGCRVTQEAIFYEKATGQILVDQITPSWFLFADLKVHSDHHGALKRVLDVATAVIGFCLTLPIWPLLALVIKCCDGGPVFYSQQRVGQNGQSFKLFKFRTMRVNAENGKSVWSSPNDPRITMVGRILRKSRLDELPQLYNVLIGQMSIIGPRPERPDIVRDLCEKIPYYAERHLIKPGITGWAQISFRYGSTITDAKRKLQFDLYYLKHMSFELDMTILFRTLGTFVRGAC